MQSTSHQTVIDDVNKWLKRVVIGLNLCPFAAKPYATGRVHITLSNSTNDTDLRRDLRDALVQLSDIDSQVRDTTILVVTDHLQDFLAFNQFLDVVDDTLADGDWEGVFQVATFHPDYQFAGTTKTDKSNLTNQSPYPILHILREDSVARALASVDNPQAIPRTNIMTVSRLDDDQIQDLFPYIAPTPKN
jgi:hypothetical protein